MKTSFKMVAMLLGIGVFPVCAQAQKKVVIEDGKSRIYSRNTGDGI